MWLIVTNGVVWSICQYVMTMSCAKTAELIEMQLGSWTQVGRRNHALDGDPDHPIWRGTFEGVQNGPLWSIETFCHELCKMAESIEIPFGMWLGWDGSGEHWLVWMEWHPAGWSVCLPLLIFACTRKSRSSLLALAHLGGPRKRIVKWLWCGGYGVPVRRRCGLL